MTCSLVATHKLCSWVFNIVETLCLKLFFPLNLQVKFHPDLFLLTFIYTGDAIETMLHVQERPASDK